MELTVFSLSQIQFMLDGQCDVALDTVAWQPLLKVKHLRTLHIHVRSKDKLSISAERQTLCNKQTNY